jgi:hypothetical protein
VGNSHLSDIVDEYFRNVPRPYIAFDYGEFISSRKLENARKHYARYDSNEEQPLLLIDETFFRSAKRGLLLTDASLYFRLKPDYRSNSVIVKKISLHEIDKLYFDLIKVGSNLIVNEKKIAYSTAFGNHNFKKVESEIINKLFKIILEIQKKDEKIFPQ